MSTVRQIHWDQVYATKRPDEVSWHQAEPAQSLALITQLNLPADAPILDVGAGATTLIPALLDRGFSDISALDISAEALARLRETLSERAPHVTMHNADITSWTPPKHYALWHDRAVLHFLTDAADQAAYGRALREAILPGGYAIISGFAPGGPERCSGLPIVQHDGESLATLIGARFELLRAVDKIHVTPTGAAQAFRYHLFQRNVEAMPGAPKKPPLWTCRRCGQRFVTRNMWHSCIRLTEAEFFGERREQRRLYRAYLKFVRQFGPVTVNINKTRISLQARVRFAGVPRVLRDGIVCGFWLKRPIESPRFLKRELIPPNNYVYSFKLTDPDQLDDEVAQWLAEAYRIGMQEKP